tara:strand:+ start:811 stop:1785 length:975 start_codon:yes stop_codon:yes gene_type:complete
MGRVQASWRMFRFSWNFVKSERVLFLYPVLVFLIQLVVIALMLSILGLITYNTVNNIGGVNKLVNTVTSFSNSSMGDPAQSVQASTMKLSDSLFTTENNILIIAVLFLYFIMGLVANLFSITVINSVIEKIDTNVINAKAALSKAFSNIGYIIQWTLFNIFVVYLIHYIIRLCERIPILNIIVALFLNTAWATFTFFALPILAENKSNPIETLKMSSKLIKKRFGTNVVSMGSLFIINFLWIVSVVALGFLLLKAVDYSNIYSTLLDINLIIFIIYFVFSLSLLILLSLVYRTVLYLYCVRGTLPEEINKNEINSVISFRKKRI